MERVYFDHNATTPIHPDLLGKVSEWAKLWGNPSSVHQDGRGPKKALRESRRSIANFLNVNPLELVFTSSGSESINQVIKGVYFHNKFNKNGRNHYLVSAVEHPATTKAFDFLKALGAEVEIISVDREKGVDLDEVKSKLRADTALVSVMLANNETGSIYPIKRICEMAHDQGALFHSDCVQALGKMDFDLKDLAVDFATFSSHKVYSLRGVGITYIKSGHSIESLIHGGGQERHRRAGTENILSILALSEVLSLGGDQVGQKIRRVTELRDRLETQIQDIPGITFTGRSSQRLGNTSNFMVDGVDGETLLMNLDIKGISISTGAACSSGSNEPSPVLRAMGLSREEASSSMRVSLGWFNTEEEVNRFSETLKACVERIRSLSSTSMASSGWS